MIWADLLSRFIAPPYETPLISVVSVTCLPYFLWMIHKGNFMTKKEIFPYYGEFIHH